MNAIKSLWASAVVFLRALPISKWLKPVWKGALKEAVQLAGDVLQESAKAEIRKDLGASLPKINALVDKFQLQVKQLEDKIHLPEVVKVQVDHIVNDLVDQLQAKVAWAANAGGQEAVTLAVDKAFDNFQAQLIERIAAL